MCCPICKGETKKIEKAPKLSFAKERRKCIKCRYAFDVVEIKQLYLNKRGVNNGN